MIDSAVNGITTTVLIYESSSSKPQENDNENKNHENNNENNIENVRTYAPYAHQAVNKIETILKSVTEKMKKKSLKYRKNKKINGIPLAYNPVPVVIIFKIVCCLNFGILNYNLKKIINDIEKTKGEKFV